MPQTMEIIEPFMPMNDDSLRRLSEIDELGTSVLALYDLELELEDIAPLADTLSEEIPFDGAMQTAEELPDRGDVITSPTCSQTWTEDKFDPEGGLMDDKDEGDE